MMMRSIVVLALLMSPVAFAQGISGPPYIAVHGDAKMDVVPDIFPLEVTLKETSTDTASTQAKIESLAKTIVDLASSENIPDADVAVSNLSISPEIKYDDKSETQIFLGNTYERKITVRFHQLDVLRQFLAKIPAAKQVQLETSAFAYSKADEARKTLVASAIKDARATADEMAAGVGMRISGVHTISNRGFNITYSESNGLQRVEVTGSRIGRANGDVVLKEGTITLDQDVYIVYALSN